MKNNKQFIYIHIPKCAGTSIWRESGEDFTFFDHNIRDKNFKYYKDSLERSYSTFSFTFVRNPWDRLASSYSFLKNGGLYKVDYEDYQKYFSKYKNFRDLVLNWQDTFFDQIHFKQQYKWICDDDDKLIVDFIGRFENIQQDFNLICDKLKIHRKQLVHKNKSKHNHYTEYYDEEMQRIVAEKYAKDIEYFGYKFGE